MRECRCSLIPHVGTDRVSWRQHASQVCMREIFSTWYIGISCQTRWLKQLRCQSTGNHRIHLSSNPRTESEPLWQSQKLAVITLPIPSMYGIFTYIWFLLMLLLSYCHYCHKISCYMVVSTHLKKYAKVKLEIFPWKFKKNETTT